MQTPIIEMIKSLFDLKYEKVINIQSRDRKLLKLFKLLLLKFGYGVGEIVY